MEIGIFMRQKCNWSLATILCLLTLCSWGENTAPLTIDEIKNLLKSESHISRKDLASMDEKHTKYELFRRQKQALVEIGNRKILEFVPTLIEYLDYPINELAPIIASARPSGVQNRVSRTRKTWPAFDALLNFGKDAIPFLESFLLNDGKDMSYRVAALAVLMDIDKSRGIASGSKMLETVGKQEEAAEAIRSVLGGKSKFLGVPLLNRLGITSVNPSD